MGERAQIVTDRLAVRATLLECLGDQLGRIIRQGRMRIRRSTKFLLERSHEGARSGCRILGRERHPDVSAFRSGRVGQYPLPAVTANEYRIEALTLRFLKDL